MIFEWDEDKRQSNLSKHGLDFWYASAVFDDAARIEYLDDRRDYGETRIRVIGKIRRGVLADWIIIMLVYTDRNGNIRIISARPAHNKEKRLYNGNS